MPTELIPSNQSLLGQYAGFATRLLAFLFDVALLSSIVVIATWFVNTTINMLIGGEIFSWITNSVPYINQVYKFSSSPIVTSIAAVAFIIGYFVFFWTFIGQTPGKYFMGVKIITMDGKPLRLHHSILRYAGYYASALLFGLGFLWILVDDQRRGWHDRLAGTCVVYIWDARPDERFLKGLSNQLALRRNKFRGTIRYKKELQSIEAPKSADSRTDSF